MKYKAVICDLDGTLLNPEHRISNYTKTIIKSIIDSGVKFFIATGRHHNDVKAIKKILDLDTIMITSNGARVHDQQNKEIISHNFPLSISKEIMELKLDEEIHVNLYSGDHWYTDIEALWVENFHAESGFTYQLKSFDLLKDSLVTKFFYIHDDPQVIINLETFFKEKYQNNLNITRSLPICLEIMPKGISKASAITEVLKLEGIDSDETIAFGDGLNDLEMLSLIKKGFIMENGSNTLKELLPNLEVIDSNANDGVAKKLKEIFFN